MITELSLSGFCQERERERDDDDNRNNILDVE
jgi:hypothetical protein